MHDRIISGSNAAVVFADLQEGIIGVGTTTNPQRLRNAVGALADLAATFSLPVIISSVPTTGGTVAPVLPEITQRHPAVQPMVRTTAGATDDPPFRAALDALGRTTLIVAGVASEVVVRLTALGAKYLGFHVVVAVDACSGFDSRTEAATFTHLSSAGIELSSVATLAAQLAGDFRTENGRAAMRALQATLTLPAHDHGHDESHDHDHDHDVSDFV